MKNYILSFVLCLFIIPLSFAQNCALNPEIEIVECLEGSYYLYVGFNQDEFPSDSFKINVNGEVFAPFFYEESPIIVGPIMDNCEEEVTAYIEDLGNPECGIYYDLGIVCCHNCNLFEPSFSSVECDDQNLIIYDLNVLSSNPNSNEYNVYANGLYIETRKYTDSIPTLVPLSILDQLWLLTLCDVQDSSCCTTIEMENPCLIDVEGCGIQGFEYEIDCKDDGSFNVYGYYNSDLAGNFHVFANGVFAGTMSYQQEDFVIEDLAGDCETIYEFKLVNAENTCCVYEFSLDEPVCCDASECDWEWFELTHTNCLDGEFYAVIYYGVTNPLSDFFNVVGNGQNYGSFTYQENGFIEIGPLQGDCETIYEFIFFDGTSEACFGETYFEEPICCEPIDTECGFDVGWEVSECNEEGLFYLTLFVSPFSNDCDGFTILDDQGNNFGFFDYSTDLVYIEGLEGDCETNYIFYIIDLCQDSCFYVFDLEEPVCCEESSPCEIVSVVTEYFPCDENGNYEMVISVNQDGSGSLFNLYLDNEYFGTFNYDESSIELGSFSGSNGAIHDILIIDANDPTCMMHIFFSQECDESGFASPLEPLFLVNDQQVEFVSPESISSLRLFTATGSKLKQLNAVDTYLNVDYPAGIYVMELIIEGKRSTHKIFIR